MKIVRTSYPISGYWDTRQGGRAENQDACGFIDTPHGLLAIVCDGMGGGPAGKQASELAVQSISDSICRTPQGYELEKSLQQAVEQAHQSIIAMGQKYPDLKGMGSTVVAVLFHKEKAIIAHVGDSRVYQFRFGHKIFRTTDHSMVAELVRDSKLTEEQARLSGQTNLITRALGGGNHLADIDVRPYEKGDRFLLCTDGIWGALHEKELVERAAKTPSLAGAVDSIVLHVDELGRNSGNTHDNLTIALFETKQDSISKEKMSRKVLHIIIGLIVSLLISLAVIVVLVGKLSASNPYEKEAGELKDLLSQKEEIIKNLQDSVLLQKNKVADALKEGIEKEKYAIEREVAAEKAKHEAEEAQKKAEEAIAKAAEAAKSKQSSSPSEIKKLRNEIVTNLGKFKKEKNTEKRKKILKSIKNDLNIIAKKDPSNQSVYFSIDTNLNSPTYTDNVKNIDSLIAKLNKIK